MTTRFFLIIAAIAIAQAASGDPAVPPERDPGGIPVAIIGRGLDYTDPAIAQRLTRDGEGEITGYDFLDNDRRPFARDSNDTAASDTKSARIISAEGQATSLIAVRADVNDASSLAKAIGFAAKSPTRIIVILIPYQDPQMRAVLYSAAQHFADKLFIVPAGKTEIEKPQDHQNRIVVSATTIEGSPLAPENPEPLAADVAVPLDGIELELAKSQSHTHDAAAWAASRVAALTARLISVEPNHSASDLKARILSLAQPWPDDQKTKTSKSGWIKQPRRHFWLE
ncbi:MAG: hypothetical protein CTY31_13655 [Hyphomicrobium sp.]|nr:MAG: hypothetical protein CTY31_13655 [Hyphomicrobium sp.]